MKQAYTGQQAAALVFGLDPNSDALGVTEELLQRMRNAYSATLWAHQASVLPRIERTLPSSVRALFPSIEADRDPFDLKCLHSWRMTEYYDEVCERMDIETGAAQPLIVAADSRFFQWLGDDQQTDFAKQLFDPHEMHVWLKFARLKSKFEFVCRENPIDECSPVGKENSKIVRSRRDLMAYAIAHAQSQCTSAADPVEIWTRLRELAVAEFPPLLGVATTGIMYTDANNKIQHLSLRALKMRIHRAR